MNINFDKPSSNYIYWSIITLAIILGAIIRLTGLGTWPLALDEYYIIKSSEFILEHGLPQFPNGGFYSRGFLLQYLIAFFISIGIKPEFAGRILPVVFNLITLIPTYMLARRVGNKLIATIVVIIFSLSIWEIEFARFARMYAPFQTIFMFYIYLLYKDYQNGSLDSIGWLFFLSFISNFVYEGSIFLAIFNFIPIFLYGIKNKFNLKYIVTSTVLFVVSYYVNMTSFRKMFSNPILPPEFEETINNIIAHPPIKIPAVLFPFSFDNIYSTSFTIIISLLSIIFSYKLYKSLSQKNIWNIFSVLILLVLALANQFGLFLLIFTVLVFLNIFNFHFRSYLSIFWLLLLFCTNLIYWYSFGITTKEWYVLFNDFASYSLWGVSKRLLVAFFNFPHNYISLSLFFKTLPVLTIYSSLIITIFLFYSVWTKKIFSNIHFLIAVLIIFILLATIPTTLYNETRYTFFIVPLMLIIVSYSTFQILDKVFDKKIANIIFIISTLSVFILSKDFNIYHLSNIDNNDVNYRIIYSNNLMKKHLYRRWDLLTPLNFVKDNLADNDIIMINENSHEYYLPRVDYYNFNYRHTAFATISVEYGKKERWSNAKLIYTNDDLVDFIENRTTTIWFTVFPEWYLFEMNFYEKYQDYLVSEGIDGLVKVYKFGVE